MVSVGIRRLHMAALLSAIMGCSGRLPALKPPKFDPVAAARAAMEQYNSNQDGIIQGAELENSPGISFSLDRIDTNRDGGATEDEIGKMIQEKWLDPGDGVMRVKCNVTLNRQPLDGATITFEPEQFLGNLVHPARGETRGGFATMSVAKEHMPHANARGVAPGLYFVRISKTVNGEELIPARYNTETTLGVEVASRASYMPGAVHFNLRK